MRPDAATARSVPAPIGRLRRLRALWLLLVAAALLVLVALSVAIGTRDVGLSDIASALGGKVEKNPGGWVFGRISTEMEGAPIDLFAAHVEQVTELPAGAEVLGGNEECPIGSYRIGRHILATQYHPEMTPEFVTALVDEYFEKLPRDVAERAKASLTLPAETERIAQRIVDFFESA